MGASTAPLSDYFVAKAWWEYEFKYLPPGRRCVAMLSFAERDPAAYKLFDMAGHTRD